VSDMVILDCVRSATRLSEGELRYQLRKREHPLADSDGLLVELAGMEREGLLRSELVVSIKDRLA
jgi:hypothetical protein